MKNFDKKLHSNQFEDECRVRDVEQDGSKNDLFLLIVINQLVGP
jgi:hypothetical protein